MDIVILDGAAATRSEYSFDRLNKYGNVIYYPRTDYIDIIERAQSAEVMILNKVNIDRHILDSLPSLRLILILATGYNVVDIDYARKKGVIVCNIPSYSTPSVAQLTLALLLECTNAVGRHDSSVKAGEWTTCPDFCYSVTKQTELQGKTIGLIGYGNIARRVGAVCSALGMQVLGYRRTHVNDDIATMTDLETIYQKSDIISLHCPATSETVGMIDKDAIEQMRDGVIIINTARGNIVDEQAVADGLASGKIAYYATDVLSSEPPQADNPLIHSPRTVITPHIAWATSEARGRLFDILEDNLRGYLSGNIINKVN